MRNTSYVHVLQEEHDAHKQYYFQGTHLYYAFPGGSFMRSVSYCLLNDYVIHCNGGGSYRSVYANRPDPIAFLPLPVSTKKRFFSEGTLGTKSSFIRLLFIL